MNEDKNIKTPRASQSRVSDKKPTTWTPPSSLDAPTAPDGFRHRWIRTETLGMDDTKNMSGKLRSGWELVRADQYPEHPYPQVAEGKYAGVIGVGGLVLARIPEEIAKSREAYFRKQVSDRDEAVNNDLLKEQHPSMPINSERQSRVTFGGTKKKFFSNTNYRDTKYKLKLRSKNYGKQRQCFRIESNWQSWSE